MATLALFDHAASNAADCEDAGPIVRERQTRNLQKDGMNGGLAGGT